MNKRTGKSRNALCRELDEAEVSLKTARINAANGVQNTEALMVVSSKLFAVSPEDQIFTNGMFTDPILEAIKKDSKKYNEDFEKRLKETVDGAKESTEEVKKV